MKSEKYNYKDSVTGVEITRLTSYRANSNHLYFTNNCFFDNGRRIVFASERFNAHNLFVMDLESGEIEQITDLPVPENLERYELHMSFVDNVNSVCVCFVGKDLLRIDLKSGEASAIYRIPDGFLNHIVSISADGRYAYTSIYENSPEKRRGNTLSDFHDSHPLSKIERIALDGSGSETVFSDYNFIAHVNASPTDPMKLTFCHEGSWSVVDHRLWTLDLSSGKVDKLHVCKANECVGHEYWFSSGDRIGFHGHRNGKPMLGAVNFDGTNDVCFDFPFQTGHIFSFDESLIIGDGNRDSAYLRVWTMGEDGYDQPRVLCAHGSTFKNQDAHPHPRLTPDGKKVLYTSDISGNNQIYLASLPERVADLPYLSQINK